MGVVAPGKKIEHCLFITVYDTLCYIRAIFDKKLNFSLISTWCSGHSERYVAKLNFPNNQDQVNQNLLVEMGNIDRRAITLHYLQKPTAQFKYVILVGLGLTDGWFATSTELWMVERIDFFSHFVWGNIMFRFLALMPIVLISSCPWPLLTKENGTLKWVLAISFWIFTLYFNIIIRSRHSNVN